jgi:hypothetical protein
MAPSGKKRTHSEANSSSSKGYKDAHGNKINPITGVAMVKSSPSRGFPGELKAYDTIQAAFIPVPDSAGTPGLSCLNLPLQGAGYNARVGSKIQLKTLRLTIALSPVPLTAAALNRIHFAVIWDRQPPNTGTLPVWSEIFKGTDGTTNVWSHPNLEQRERFRVLWEERVVMPQFKTTGEVVSSNYPQTDFVWDKFLNLSGLDTMFRTSGGTLGDIATGALYFYCGAAAGAITNVTYQARLRYED